MLLFLVELLVAGGLPLPFLLAEVLAVAGLLLFLFLLSQKGFRPLRSGVKRRLLGALLVLGRISMVV